MAEAQDEIVTPEVFAKRAKWRIVNDTGRAQDTHVFTPDGVEVRDCITKVEILPIGPGDVVQACITVFASIDIIADVEQRLMRRP